MTPIESKHQHDFQESRGAQSTGSEKRPVFVAKLREARESRRNIDALSALEQFSPLVRPKLVAGLQHIQFTDGCTGGCPWCSFDVLRKITAGFSYESFLNLFDKYGTYFPDTIALYWASDPLDIAGKKANGELYHYPQLVAELLNRLEGLQRIYTSTVIPDGTYEHAKELLIILHEHFLRHNYYDDEYGLLHTVRFSRTEKNADTIARLHRELSDMGLHSGFLMAQFGAAEERTIDRVKRLGQFIKHPERDPLTNDINTVACYDGTFLSVDGLSTMVMEAATKDSPFGYVQKPVVVNNDEVAVPVYVRANNYAERAMSSKMLKGSPAHMLPDTCMQFFDAQTGQLKRVEKQPSLRRDLLSYTFALYALKLLPTQDLSSVQRAAIADFGRKVDERWAQTEQLLETSTDEEAHSVVETWYVNVKREVNKRV